VPHPRGLSFLGITWPYRQPSPRGFCTSTVFAQFECDTIIDRVIAGMERETQRKRTAWLTRVHCGHLWAKLLALFDLSAPVA
jgi:hypothetical protein